MLDKQAILGREWPLVEDVVSILKLGDHIRSSIVEMERLVAYLKGSHHLDKYAWTFELNEERYEHARSVSRSPQTESDSSPSRSLHWSEGGCSDMQDVEEEPLRFHCHATFRFKFEKNSRRTTRSASWTPTQCLQWRRIREKGGSGISTCAETKASSTPR